MRQEIIMAGFGGQGIMFMGTLLAYAAMEEGKKVTFFPSYGAEMRGGTANCSVVISDDEIGSPVISSPDTVIALNQPSTDKFTPKIKKGGLLIINASLVNKIPENSNVEKFEVTATKIAEELGDKRITNMVALGVYIKQTKILRLESLIEGLSKNLLANKDKKLIDINIKALRKGYEL